MQRLLGIKDSDGGATLGIEAGNWMVEGGRGVFCGKLKKSA